MALSSAAVRALLSRETAETVILLLTIEHDDLPAPLRFARNTYGDDIVSNGDTFIGVPFELNWPSDNDETPTAQLETFNVDRAIGQALEDLVDPPVCTLQIVLASSPNTIEREALQFEMRNVRWDALALTCDLTQIQITSEPWPKYRVTPKYFPALFR